RLDPESRRLRFCAAANDSFIESYCETLRRVPTLVHGFFVDDDLRAAAELRPILDGWPVVAEAAFSVEREWQDSGIGTELLDRTLRSARNRGVSTLYMVCLRENARMQSLARKFDAEIHFEQGEIAGTVDASAVDVFSLLRESLEDGQALVTALIENSFRTRA
ncbi:MAG TPA: GNAT family N-acetyltransferase, partial [Sphingomonadaceae bacterium]|nr:GNAT family N-acetyltransferase [Sphingomonadaceae bacterium]